jgi:hypothetical protein
MSPDPINPSEQEAEDEIDRSQAEGVAAPLRPSGACDLPPSKDGYAAFWDAWGRRVTVADTERLIASKVEEGVVLADVIAGVGRFRKYCNDTGKPPRMKPAAFVHGEKWRDDWQLYPAEPAKAKKGAREKTTKKESKVKRVKNPWQWNRAFTQYRSKLRSQNERSFDNFEKLGGGMAAYSKLVTREMEVWELANPAPPYWKNTITGKTWGTIQDPKPEPDWSPAEHGSE